jgi:hypothetical protein
LEALLFTGRWFVPVFFVKLGLNLGEAGASSDAIEKVSSFMAAMVGCNYVSRFPKYKVRHWTTPNFSGRLIMITRQRMSESQQQQLVNNSSEL